MAVLGKLTLYGGEDPQQEQLERVAEVNQRVKMMVWARWVLISALAIYQFSMMSTEGEAWGSMLLGPFLIPTTAFVLMFFYNLIFQFSHKNIGHIKGVRYFQVFLDMVFSLVIIHYSGGSLSWGWIVFPMIVTESAILLDGSGDTWTVAVLSSAAYGALLLAELNLYAPPVRVPFLSFLLEDRFTHDILLWLRFNLVVVFFAIVCTYLMAIIHRDQEKLQEKVVIDALTGAYNSTHFYHLLNSEINRAKRYNHKLSVLYVDLDNFKKINDLGGHLKGDNLIREVALTFKSTLRRSDTEPAYDIDILCRYSGGSFMMILPDTPAEGAKAAAARILKLTRVKTDSLLSDLKKAQADNPEVSQMKLTVSIGTATFPDNGENIDDLIRKVEENLKEAKQAGKNRTIS
ncbi:MAG: GGDEF domain-containing protein [bacterium]